MSGAQDKKRGAHDEPLAEKAVVDQGTSPAADEAPPIYTADLDDLLAFFARPNLTIAQAEELLSRVHDARPQLVERLLSWLEEVGDGERPALRRAPSPLAGLPSDMPAGMMHDVALVLLTYLGDQEIVPRLRALVCDTQVSDEFKLKLISVIHDLVPQQDAQLLLDHLRYPGKAMLQSHRKHLQRLTSPLERSFWLESMVEDMSADARMSFARSSADVDDPAAVPVLICMCYDPDPQVALAAIDAVERYKDARALPALHELARYHPHQSVRRAAQNTTDRLSIRAPLSPQVEPAPLDPLQGCYLTTVDGSGEQAVVFVRHLPAKVTSTGSLSTGATSARSEFLRLVQVAFNDQTGIEQCFGLDVRVDDLEEVLGELDGQGLVPVQVSYEQALAQLAQARRWTWRAEQLLPLSFVAWHEWIYGPFEALSCDERQWVAPQLGGDISDRLRGRLYVKCYELLYQDEFVDWGLETPAIGELGEDYMRLIEERGEPLDADALRALLRRGVDQVAPPPLRRQIQERLYRMAPLLSELYEQDEIWQWAVVAADELSAESRYPIQEHPLLLGLVGYSLQLALDRDLDWTIAL